MVALAVAAFAAASPARANNAFPDEFSVHFPAAPSQTIFIGANFGMLVSQDDGLTWRYACEPWVVAGSNAALAFANVSLYDATADGALIAAVFDISTVTRSTDTACTWPNSSGSGIAGQKVSDFFPDPNDASLVLATVVASKDGLPNGNYIVGSHDGGKTFEGPHLYDTPTSTDLLTGIEIARSKPGVYYATLMSTSGGQARFLASTDSGATWTATALDIGSAEPRIMAVDPDDEKKVYLRVISSALADGILSTADGGQTFTKILSIDGQLSSFLRADDGALYAGTRAGKLYVRNAGATNPMDFTVRSAPHLRCLGQRRGTSRIYGCADMLVDGYSLVSSDDKAVTFQPVMSLKDLLGPLTCAPVQTNCQAHWQRIQCVLRIGIGADAGQTCGAAQPPPNPGGSHCASVGGSASALLVLLAYAWRRRRWS